MYTRLLEEIQSQEEKEAWFEERTNKHIERVKEAARKIVAKFPELKELLDKVEHHDEGKFKDPERDPYIELTWRHKNDNWKSYKTPGTIDDELINVATMHHVTSHEHHPEYWNPKEANIDPNDRDKSTRLLDASAMPRIALAEMVADWQAMSEELGKNTAREWFNKQKDVRWKFTPEQEEFIDKMLSVFEQGEENVQQVS